MNKELIDRAWRCLPREFREEVKKMFAEDIKHPYINVSCGITTARHNERGQRLIDLFGEHNLTSDNEGEEMVCCERKWVQQMYADGVGTHYLLNIFGDSCLPDEEPKPTISNSPSPHPKKEENLQNEGEKAKNEALFDNTPDKSEPRPAVPGLRSDGTAHFDNIITDSFRNHNRLQIAAMAMQGALANPNIVTSDGFFEQNTEYICNMALYYADALIEAASKNKDTKNKDK